MDNAIPQRDRQYEGVYRNELFGSTSRRHRSSFSTSTAGNGVPDDLQTESTLLFHELRGTFEELLLVFRDNEPQPRAKVKLPSKTRQGWMLPCLGWENGKRNSSKEHWSFTSWRNAYPRRIRASEGEVNLLTLRRVNRLHKAANELLQG